MSAMTKGEREDLQRLIRQREKVLKDAARQRSAELLADFENQMGSEYSFDQDEVWAKATEIANREVAKMQKTIAARCHELGIPDRFAPNLHLHWSARGYDNVIEKRKKELRRMAQSRIEAIESAAMVEIGMQSVQAQTEIAMHGLTSDGAKAFIERLPKIEDLMPRLAFDEIAGEADPPVVEQLVSPNALRQRRYRERHRNVTTPSRNAELPKSDGEG